MRLKFRDCQYKIVHCSKSKGQSNGTIKNNYFHPWSAKTSSLVQVRNSLMKREDEADAEKKKLQNRCNNLEEKSVMLHSENVRHKSCSFNLKPNLERRSGKTRGGAVPCEEWNWGDEAGIAGDIMSHVHPRILIHMLYQPRLLRYAGHMFFPNFSSYLPPSSVHSSPPSSGEQKFQIASQAKRQRAPEVDEPMSESERIRSSSNCWEGWLYNHLKVDPRDILKNWIFVIQKSVRDKSINS